LKLGAGQQPELPADVKLLAEIRDILAHGAKPEGPAGAPLQEPKRP
jgi:hypothetical protein